jgi:hypothetical protein
MPLQYINLTIGGNGTDDAMDTRPSSKAILFLSPKTTTSHLMWPLLVLGTCPLVTAVPQPIYPQVSLYNMSNFLWLFLQVIVFLNLTHIFMYIYSVFFFSE